MKMKGYLCGFIAAVTWGTVFLVGRVVMSSGSINPLVVAFWRCFFAAVFLLFCLRNKASGIFLSLKQDWKSLLFLAFTGIFLMNILVFTSVIYTTAASSGILMNANPIFILILATIFLKEKLTPYKVLAVLLGFAGCAMVMKGTSAGLITGGKNLLLGNLLALGAALCWSSYTVAGGKPTNKYGATLTTFITLTLGTLLLAVTMLVGKINFWNIKPTVILAGAYLGIVPTGIGFTLWYQALNYITAGELGIFQYLSAVVTVVLARIFLKESLNFSMLFGMLLILFSVGLPELTRKIKSSVFRT